MGRRLAAVLLLLSLTPALAGCKFLAGACLQDVTGNCQVMALVTAPLWVPIALATGDLKAGNASVATRDPQTAQYYETNAQQGHAWAQRDLGAYFESGTLGLPKDYVQADMWYRLAADGGDSIAPLNRDAIEKKMTAAQIAEARRRASEWKALRAGAATPTPTASPAPAAAADQPIGSTPAPPASAPSHPRLGPV